MTELLSKNNKEFTTAKLDPSPHFENIEPGRGYKLCLHHYENKKAIYEYTANEKTPLTFVDFEGMKIRPDNHFFSDMGSVPPVLQAIPGFAKDRHLFPFLFHDSAYTHGGLWIKTKWETDFRFIILPRRQVDELLVHMIQFDVVPGCGFKRNIFLFFLTCFGASNYNKGDAREKSFSSTQ